MISQERASHPATDEEPTGAPSEPGASEGDDASGTSFDDIDEAIDEAIEESMIASDPPAFTPGIGIGAPDHSSRPADRP